MRWLSGSSAWVSLLGHQMLAPTPWSVVTIHGWPRLSRRPGEPAVPGRPLGHLGLAVVVHRDRPGRAGRRRGGQRGEEGVAVAPERDGAPAGHHAVHLERLLEVDLHDARRPEDPVGDGVPAADAAVGRVDGHVQIVELDVPPGARRTGERASQRVRVRERRCLPGMGVLGGGGERDGEEDAGEAESAHGALRAWRYRAASHLTLLGRTVASGSGASPRCPRAPGAPRQRGGQRSAKARARRFARGACERYAGNAE